jgi:hypothetical protein
MDFFLHLLDQWNGHLLEMALYRNAPYLGPVTKTAFYIFSRRLYLVTNATSEFV